MESFSDYIIFKSAIRHNLLQCKNFNKNAKVCAVVKADGYGIGTFNVVNQVDDLVDFYAVSCFIEAKKLRKITKKPILILNFVHMSNFEYCSKNNISITISSFQNVKILQKFSKSLLNEKLKDNKKGYDEDFYKPLKIHLAINTGMNRIGFCHKNEFYKSLITLNKLNCITIEGIYTHFYNAENLKDTVSQNRIFMQFLNLLKSYNGTKNVIVHTANSLAYLKYNSFNYDMVRLGIVLYGGLDLPYNCQKKITTLTKANYAKIIKFKPAICIKSKIISINSVKKGNYVGYNKNFVAKKDMVVATVPLGYADGIFRSFSKKGKVIIAGKKCRVVGNICMDMFMVDVTNLKVKTFDEVILIGKDKFNNEITLNEFAKYCGTIGYEILTNIKQGRFNVKYK